VLTHPFTSPHLTSPPLPSTQLQTRQHVGKTSVSLALTSGLLKRFPDRLSFMKPVGQQHLTVFDTNAEKEVLVDKDVKLLKEHFELHQPHNSFSLMSPIIIPRGYTKKYVDGTIDRAEQTQKIMTSFTEMKDNSDMILMEGTGHIGVGSCVGLNNANVASLTGADMILVANGGIGNAFDDLSLNYAMCKAQGVRVAGVVINKVMPSKYEQTRHYMSRLLWERWKLPLLGCVPDKPFLGCPALADLEQLFGTKLMSGSQHRMRHYSVDQINLVTTSLGRFLENLRVKPSRTMYVTHVTRNDIILGFLAEAQRKNAEGVPFEASLILCGRKPRYALFPEIKDMITSTNAPVMEVNRSTRMAMQDLQIYTPKLTIDDKSRVNQAIAHYEGYIDFDELLRRTSSDGSDLDDPGDGRYSIKHLTEDFEGEKTA
jgi:BioD-like phosphotransacetylase family protein